ncbi:MAG: hypothetical protein PHQ11_14910 [Paludibacter sp.]|nr:hypothetical protein [Paludibacter sp.]
MGQEGIRTMDIIKKRIVKELEKKGKFVSSAEKTDNNVYDITVIYNERQVSMRIRVLELVPDKFEYDNISIPGLWEKIYDDIVFMDDNNFIFLKTIDVSYWFWDYLADYTSIFHVNLYTLGYKDPAYEV